MIKSSSPSTGVSEYVVRAVVSVRAASCRAEVAQSAFGPRFQAAVATLSMRNRISRRDVVELCEQLFGSRISTGTVDAILARAVTRWLSRMPIYWTALRGADAVNMDETGWRTAGERRALWGIFDRRYAYLHVAARPSRGPCQGTARGDEGDRDRPTAGGPTRTSLWPAASFAGRT